MADKVTLYEVGPRDGLQNEARPIPTADKIALIDALSDCGFRRIEATSFVSPRWVPQLADAAEVMAGIRRRPGTVYSVLTPNLKGFEAALAAGADEVAVFASASETFSRKNINCSIAESLERFQPLIAAAQQAGLPVRGYVSCICDCPYEGAVHPDATADVAARLLALGCHQIALGETLGRATPDRVAPMLEAVLTRCPPSQLAGHFHDTSGHALENIRISLQRGLRIFDASVGGLGGCPYAPGAAGNVASAAVVALVEAEGFITGIDRDRLAAVTRLAQGLRSPK